MGGKKTDCMVIMSMKPFTKIWKFMAPESGVQGLGSDQIGLTLYIININLDLRKSSSVLPNIFVRTEMHGYDVHEVPYLNCKIHHDI